MFTSESPFGKTFGASLQDPLASFGWRGLDTSQPQASAEPAEYEEDVVPMVLETAPAMFTTSPRMASNRLMSFAPRRTMLPADSTWVTIFGVLPHQTALVKTQVEQQLGTDIVDVRPGGGNFFHARFPTTSDARSALQLNGYMIDGSLIIGVTPCLLSGLEEDPLKTLAGAGVPRRKTLVPSVNSSRQPSLFDPLWNLFDILFQYN